MPLPKDKDIASAAKKFGLEIVPFWAVESTAPLT
jgi:hypothetical protein